MKPEFSSSELFAVRFAVKNYAEGLRLNSEMAFNASSRKMLLDTAEKYDQILKKVETLIDDRFEPKEKQ